MNVLLFPGQGSQLVGMGSEFYKNFEEAKNIFKKADEKLGFSISQIILDGPSDQLQLTKNTQPAILTVSYTIFKILKDEFNLDLKLFKYFAGHSLGEYSALVCAGALDFEDAIYLLHERGKAMQNAVPVGAGAMIAVLGLQTKELLDLLEEKNKLSVCEIANDNADGQIIVSGDKDSIDYIKKDFKDNKIKTIPLKVSAPFHCSLMKPAAEVMNEKISQTTFKSPLVEIINNVNAKPVKDPTIIKKLLVDQIFLLLNGVKALLTWKKRILKILLRLALEKRLLEW